MKQLISTLAKTITFTGFIASVIFAANPAQAVLISGVSVTSSKGSIDANNDVYHLTDQSGLSLPVSLGSTHDAVSNNTWLSNNAGGASGNLVFNLGQSYVLNQVGIWNYNGTTARGVQDFSIDASTDNISYSSVFGTTTLNQSGGTSTEASQLFNLNTTTAQYIRLNYTSNYGDGTFTGLSEVQFDGVAATAVPWETDALPIIGSTGLFTLGILTKRKLAKAKLSQF
jgi:hypothetical protein